MTRRSPLPERHRDPRRGSPTDDLQRAVFGWWEEHGRRLAFRATSDPYAVLVSEIMAQQTQVSRVEPAWRAFMQRFPTVAELASASPDEVLRAWAGLGYNRRALSLLAAARAIVERHAGCVPSDIHELESLPGVGRYTARAVAAIAFGQPVAAVDTNVRRVVGRAIHGRLGRADRDVQQAADRLVPAGRPADWTHALMDLGASVCRPAEPRCDGCPMRPWCRFARRPGTVRAHSGRRPRPSRSGEREQFEHTTRWLRGRIVARLRELEPGAWLRFAEPIGVHDLTAVASALAALERDGLVERRPTDPTDARLPAG